MSLQTLDQQRAAFAWNKIAGLGGDLAEYRDLVRKLPAMVQTNGLGQTVAFLLIQDDDKKKLYEHLQEWLCQQSALAGSLCPKGQAPNLMLNLASGSSLVLRRATLEVQALAVWLKRFAEAQEKASSSTPAGGS